MAISFNQLEIKNRFKIKFKKENLQKIVFSKAVQFSLKAIGLHIKEPCTWRSSHSKLPKESQLQGPEFQGNELKSVF